MGIRRRSVALIGSSQSTSHHNSLSLAQHSRLSVRECVRACVRARVHACMHACMHAYVCVLISIHGRESVEKP